MKDMSKGLECRPIPCQPDDSSSQPRFPDDFRYVTRSIPGPGIDVGMFEDKLRGCKCQQTCQEQICLCLDRFGPAYHLQTGRLLPDAVRSSRLKPVVECNSQCGCGATCPSRVVQKGVTVRLMVAPSAGRGFGLFACQDIPRLTFVCEYAGEIIGVSEVQERLRKAEGGMNYLIVLREHCSSGVLLTCVDPRWMGNIGRFANHSCDPNLLMVPVRVDNCVPRLALFARQNVTAGEELTFDYSGETVLERLGLPGVACGWLKRDSIKGVTSKFPDNFDKTVTPCHTEGVETYSKETVLGCSGLSYTGCEVLKSDNSEEMTCKFSRSFDQTGKPYSKEIEGQLNSDLPETVELETTLHREQHHRVVNDDSNSKDVSVVDTDPDCSADKEKPVNSVTYCTDRRKRKLYQDVYQTTARDADSGKKSAIDPVQFNWKPCLCGSQCCKGYLPFDSSILDSYS